MARLACYDIHMKISIRELFERLDKNAAGEASVDTAALFDAAGVSYFEPEHDSEDQLAFEHRVKAYQVIKWLCTDTWVGVDAYYFDGEPLALSRQTARKNPVEIDFVSLKVLKKFRTFLFELMERSSVPDARYLGLDAEFGEDTYAVDHGTALLTDTALYMGEPAEVIEKYSYYSNAVPKVPVLNADVTLWGKVKVRLKDGSEKLIPLKEFRIPLPLKDAGGVQ